MIVAASGLLILATAGAMLLHRYLTDLRGLADATLEGLAIVHGERIVEVNARFARMLGTEPRELLGQPPGRWLATVDGHSLLADRDVPVEATLVASGDAEQVFEIGTREIEYRGRECRVLALRDLTEKKVAQRRIEHMACHDSLTDLSNRSVLDERLTHGLARVRRGETLAILCLDLDRFKDVNDALGHPVGDILLRSVAERLRGCLRDTDLITRLGGDEFVILQTVSRIPRMPASWRERSSIASVRPSKSRATRSMSASASESPSHLPTARIATDCCHNADIALYRAKSDGRGTCRFFELEMDASLAGPSCP